MKEADQKKFERIGIKTGRDFLLHLPLRYEDETVLHEIASAAFTEGRIMNVQGRVESVDMLMRPKRQLLVKIRDKTGEMVLRYVNYHPWQLKLFPKGATVRAFGEVRFGFYGAEMIHPQVKPVREGTPLPDTLTPVYPTTAGLSQYAIRKGVADALAREPLDDTVAKPVRAKYGLPSFGEAVRFLHAPPPGTDQEAILERKHPACRTVAFDELLAQQLSMRRAQMKRRALTAHRIDGDESLVRDLLGQLGFALTADQRGALDEILADMRHDFPMQRLLQGDVGSGKTAVAALAAAKAIGCGFQAALMAPTDILAQQHAERLSAWFTPLGVNVIVLTASLKKKEKDKALAAMASDGRTLVVGTHALITEAAVFKKLSLVIVDEQHRFGVSQRLTLRGKGAGDGRYPHQLMMSATPIPRTLAMTFYADLDVSVIRKLPPGRTPVVTRVIDSARRDELVARIREAAKEGRQVYWVCPLIEESEKLELQTAVETHEGLAKAMPDVNVALVHGRLPAAEKRAVMDAFSGGQVQVLVATTVIEVGVDVPNASLMVIENAERFGLSQLHQLRGRVGRGSAESVCILMYQAPLGQIAKERLKVMRKTADGFEIAARDLELRGPGEFLGAKQSGEVMLRFATLSDEELIAAAAETAKSMLAAGEDSPAVLAHLDRWLGAREDYLNG